MTFIESDKNNIYNSYFRLVGILELSSLNRRF